MYALEYVHIANRYLVPSTTVLAPVFNRYIAGSKVSIDVFMSGRFLSIAESNVFV